jgi:hypothetical protein
MGGYWWRIMTKNEQPNNDKPPRGKPVKLLDNFDEAVDRLTGGPVTPVSGPHPPKPEKKE